MDALPDAARDAEAATEVPADGAPARAGGCAAVPGAAPGAPGAAVGGRLLALLGWGATRDRRDAQNGPGTGLHSAPRALSSRPYSVVELERRTSCGS